MSRSVAYVSGTRADYGLMRRTLHEMAGHAELDLSILATGQHLEPGFGDTIREIEADGFRIRDRIPAGSAGGGGLQMSAAIGQQIAGFSEAFQRDRPDIVLLLGDRGEMLAGAVAGLHAGAAVVHIHGGERSGTVDEPVRHAISKLSHLHLTATENAAERLRRMGEDDWRVRVVGAPGLDDIHERDPRGRRELFSAAGLDPERRAAVMVFHPVVQDAGAAGEQVRAVLDALAAEGLQILLLDPNSDAGGASIRREIKSFTAGAEIAVRRETHLPRPVYLAWLAAADLLIGNSSSGVIESASLGIPCVNVGDRQNARDRNGNVVDVPGFEASGLRDGITRALALGRQDWTNIWGDGHTAPRIAGALAGLELSPVLFRKLNAY